MLLRLEVGLSPERATCRFAPVAAGGSNGLGGDLGRSDLHRWRFPRSISPKTTELTSNRDGFPLGPLSMGAFCMVWFLVWPLRRSPSRLRIISLRKFGHLSRPERQRALPPS